MGSNKGSLLLKGTSDMRRGAFQNPSRHSVALYWTKIFEQQIYNKSGRGFELTSFFSEHSVVIGHVLSHFQAEEILIWNFGLWLVGVDLKWDEIFRLIRFLLMERNSWKFDYLSQFYQRNNMPYNQASYPLCCEKNVLFNRRKGNSDDHLRRKFYKNFYGNVQLWSWSGFLWGKIMYSKD